MQIDRRTDANIIPKTPPQDAKHAPPIEQSSKDQRHSQWEHGH